MQRSDQLRNARNALLRLHKNLLDHERRIYEGINGPASSGQFLNLLLESPEFAWLRKFSALIVAIDEMFAQKDGFTEEAVEAHIVSLRRLVLMEDEDETFRAKYQAALQQDLAAAAQHGELRDLLSEPLA